MGKTTTVKVTPDLLTALIGPAHKEAERRFEQAEHERSVNRYDIARNCEQLGHELTAITNEARRLLGLPGVTYEHSTWIALPA